MPNIAPLPPRGMSLNQANRSASGISFSHHVMGSSETPLNRASQSSTRGMPKFHHVGTPQISTTSSTGPAVPTVSPSTKPIESMKETTVVNQGDKSKPPTNSDSQSYTDSDEEDSELDAKSEAKSTTDTSRNASELVESKTDLTAETAPKEPTGIS